NTLQRLAAGSAAGATSVVATYPLDLMRARLAVQMETPEGASRYKDVGLLRAFRAMHAEHGLRHFYRGMLPTVIGILPYAGITFTTFETLKQFWRERYNDVEPSSWAKLVFGGTAGLVGQASTYPLDIARRRMQTEGYSPIHAHVTCSPAAPGAGAAAAAATAANARSAASAQGVSNSNRPNSGSAGFHTWSRPPASEACQQVLPSGTRPSWSHAASASLRGALQRVQCSQRTEGSSSSSSSSSSRGLGPHGTLPNATMTETLRRIVATDGVRGLFKGLTMNIVKGPVGVGVSFTTYDFLKRTLDIDE
ncbi:MAG: hypothetical protein EOO41_05770, partial [Methanobacteriota archaeon]